METVLILTGWEGMLMAGAKDAAKHPSCTVQNSPPPPIKDYLCQNVQVLRMRNPDLTKPWGTAPRSFTQIDVLLNSENWLILLYLKLGVLFCFVLFCFTSGVCFAISLIKVEAFFFTYSSLSFRQVSTTGKISASTTISARSTECFAIWLRAERTWRC